MGRFGGVMTDQRLEIALGIRHRRRKKLQAPLPLHHDDDPEQARQIKWLGFLSGGVVSKQIDRLAQQVRNIYTFILVSCTTTDQIEEQRKRCASYSHKALVFAITTFVAYLGSASASTGTISYKMAVASFFLAMTIDLVSAIRMPNLAVALVYLSWFLLVLVSYLLLISFNKDYSYAILPVPLPIIIALLQHKQQSRAKQLSNTRTEAHQDVNLDLKAGQHHHVGKKSDQDVNTNDAAADALSTKIEAGQYINTDKDVNKNINTKDGSAQALHPKIESNLDLKTNYEASENVNAQDDATNKALWTKTEDYQDLNTHKDADQDIVTKHDTSQTLQTKIIADKDLKTGNEADKVVNTEDEAAKSHVSTKTEAVQDLNTAKGVDKDININDEAVHALRNKTKADQDLKTNDKADQDLDGIFNLSASIVNCGGLISIILGHYMVGPNQLMAVSAVGFLFFFTIVLGLYLMMVTTVRNVVLTLHVSELAFLLMAVLMSTLVATLIYGVPLSENESRG